MVGRWLIALGALSLPIACSLVTDFSGVSDGKPDASGSGASGGAATGGSAGVSGKPAFPRLALFETSDPKDFDDPAHQKDAARVHINIMGIYPGWEQSHGPVEQVAKNVKALNPNTKLFVLVHPERFRSSTSGDAYQTVIDKLDQESWWLYVNGTSGTKAEWTGPFVSYATNMTLFTPKDGEGLQYPEWFARWAAQTYDDPNPSLDGLLTIGLDWRPNLDGDFDRDGTTDPADDPTVGEWHRQGYRKYFDELAQEMPGKLQLGELSSLGQVGAKFTELEGVLHGGIVSNVIGESYSVENTGWNAMMIYYRKALAVTREPKLVVFHMSGTVTDYTTFRYGFASCLLDDGYFAFEDSNDGFGLRWFDEYDFVLGQPTSPPPSLAWSNGVYRRDFEHGIALVNPRGNGPQTVDLGGTFKHLSGTQAPSINNGQSVTSVTLPERDGLILAR